MTPPLDLLMFAALIVCILAGFPVAFTIAGVAVAFAFMGSLFGTMDLALLGALGQRVFGVITNDVLIAIPLFVLMGVVLEKSRIAEQLLETMGQLCGSLRGGLGLSVVIVGALLAASTGIVGATVIAMGLIALPTMLRSGYQPAFAAGIVCTAGTLGQIIPPSTLLIILSDVMSNGYQQAQYEQGKFSVETLSVGQLFAGALLPGLLLVLIYMVYILTRAWLRPEDAPPAIARPASTAPEVPHASPAGAVASARLPSSHIDAVESSPPRPDTASSMPEAGVNLRSVLSAVAPPVLLIIAVLGAILGGIATPTEAASIGAVGAILMAGARVARGVGGRFILAGAAALIILAVLAGSVRVRLQRSDATILDWALGLGYGVLALIGVTAVLLALWRLRREDILTRCVTQTMTVTAMIFATIVTASLFSLVFVGLGGEERVASILTQMPGGANGALLFCLALIFVLGFFLDFVEITVILLPLIVPGLILMGHDPIWLAMLIAINLQTSFLTPPFGFSLFYLRSVAPASLATGQIYRGVAPFIGLQIVGVAIIWFWPQLTSALPALLF